MVEISDLRDVPHFSPAVVQQNQEVWGPFADISDEAMASLFQLDVERSSLPATLVAHDGDAYVGCVSLRDETMGMLTHPDSYMDVSPWLSNMWVDEKYRGSGIATQLVSELESLALRLGFNEVFLATLRPDSVYHKAGYTDVAQRRIKGTPLYIVSRKL